MNEAIYTLLIWIVPMLLGIIGFFLAIAAKSLIKLSNDVGEIKLAIKEVSVKHESLEDRIEKIEHRIFA